MLSSCKELTRSSLGKDLSTNPRPFPRERHEQFCIINTFPGYGMYVGTQTRGKIHPPTSLSQTVGKRLVQRRGGGQVFCWNCDASGEELVLVCHHLRPNPEMRGKDHRKVLLQCGNVMEILPRNGVCRLSITSSMVFWGVESEARDRKFPRQAQAGFECG